MTTQEIATLRYELAELRAENARLREQLGTEVQFTPKELAARLGVTTRTLYAWVKAGRLPEPVMYNRRTIRWNQSELREAGVL